MGLTFAGSSTSAGAPQIEAGIYDARFDGVVAKTLEKSQFDPNVFIWTFTLFEDGEPLYDEGEPIEVDRVTSQSLNTKSKTTPGAVKVLKALMTPAEFTAFENEESIQADELLGRFVQVQLVIKENGWPTVESVMPAKRASGRERKAS